MGKLSNTICRNIFGGQIMEGHRVFQKTQKSQALTPIRHPFSAAGSRFCSAALREAYLASLAVKREIRLDKIFTWLFQKPFSAAFLYC